MSNRENEASDDELLDRLLAGDLSEQEIAELPASLRSGAKAIGRGAALFGAPMGDGSAKGRLPSATAVTVVDRGVLGQSSEPGNVFGPFGLPIPPPGFHQEIARGERVRVCQVAPSLFIKALGDFVALLCAKAVRVKEFCKRTTNARGVLLLKKSVEQAFFESL